MITGTIATKNGFIAFHNDEENNFYVNSQFFGTIEKEELSIVSLLSEIKTALTSETVCSINKVPIKRMSYTIAAEDFEEINVLSPYQLHLLNKFRKDIDFYKSPLSIYQVKAKFMFLNDEESQQYYNTKRHEMRSIVYVKKQ